MDPLPASMSPLSYPSQLRNLMNSPDRGNLPSSPTPRISLSGSPGGLRRFPGSSPSLHRPTPLGQRLQKQAEKNSTQGSRNSIQGSRASISALGSRTSFSGSRNSFLSSNMSRDEIRASGYLLANSKTMSEDGGGSQISLQSLMKQRSLDVPTRESPVPLQTSSQKKEPMCISNPFALQEDGEGREDGDGVDENDLRTDPLVPIMTSTPENQGADDFPTKEEKQQRVAHSSWKSDESGDSVSRKKNLQQLTSLGREEGGASTDAASASSGATGGRKDDSSAKEEKPRPKPMSRLEKLTSLDYIRSSFRRAKKRVSFLTRTPDSTPKAKKKTPPHTLPVDLTPDPLTFGNPGAFDSEERAISPRIQTPSPLSPEFETVDEYPQRYPDTFYHPDIYPETHSLRPPILGGGGGAPTRMRAYTDVSMYPVQLSQPTYYPSTMHYPQPNYPQLSQQYIPQPYALPQHMNRSPAHRSHGPVPPQRVHPPLHPPETYSRRYTDTAALGSAASARMAVAGRGRGSSAPSQNHKHPSTDTHRGNTVTSPDMYTDMSSDQLLSQDRFSETSNVSDIGAPSPDSYTGMVPGRDSYFEAPLRFRSIPTSPQERPYSPQYYPPGAQFREHVIHTQPHYTERSIDNQMGYRQSSSSQILSPVHYRERMPDNPPHGGRYRRNSIEHQPLIRLSSAEPAVPHHSRGSSIDNQPPIAGHIRRTVDNQLPNSGHFRRSSVDGQPPGTGRRTSIDNHPGSHHQGYSDFQPILEPGPPRNGIDMDGWQHSQRDNQTMQYGMGSQQQYDRLGLPEWDDNEATPTGPDPGVRPADSGNTKMRVSWNTEIIEHTRTPSDCSDHYNL